MGLGIWTETEIRENVDMIFQQDGAKSVISVTIKAASAASFLVAWSLRHSVGDPATWTCGSVY